MIRRTAKWRMREDGSATAEVLFTWDGAHLAERVDSGAPRPSAARAGWVRR
ncbi:hypothetical protein ACQEV4_07005 [Streptomyces shenzhenensis]|uniref:hypothetical protein n=1 Tax=Streptomyces shenzhenensis TaxID=943815 RepID=UPI003D8EBF19